VSEINREVFVAGRHHMECASGVYLDLLDRLAQVDLLHVDDLGAEKTSEWVLEQLYAIVNARYESERSMVVTTNLAPPELEEQITPRTVSRLFAICGEPLPLFGADQRKPKDDDFRLPEPLGGSLRASA
jgi:DNA replication protein DnaC